MRVHQSIRNIGLSKIVQVSEQAAKIAPQFEKETGLPFIYFQRGEVGYPAPSFIAEGYVEAFSKGLTKYPKSGGEAFFKEAILQEISKDGCGYIGTNNIVVTSGGQEGLQLILSLFRGGKCLVFTPAWPCLFDNILPYTQTECVQFPLDVNGWTINFDALEKALQDVDTLYFNSPHNPTGKVFSEDEIYKIAGLCDKYNVIMICDEAYMDLIYQGKHHCPVKYFNNVIAVRTFSKAFAATGLRVGYAFSRREDLISHMVRAEYTQTAGIPAVSQYAFSKALNHPERKQWQETMRSVMRKRGEFLFKGLGKDINTLQGAFYWFGNIQDMANRKFSLNADEWASLLLEKGIAIVPGSAFGKDFKNFARLSFSTMEPDLIESGAKRFKEALSNI